MEATYMGDQNIKARIGDVVMVSGNARGIVIAMDGTFVSVLLIGTKNDTGETFVLPTRHIEKLPANQCHFMEKQTLTL